MKNEPKKNNFERLVKSFSDGDNEAVRIAAIDAWVMAESEQEEAAYYRHNNQEGAIKCQS